MLSPKYLEYLDSVENPVARLFDELEEYITRDIIRRIAKSGNVTPTAEWQMMRLVALGELPETVVNQIQRALNLSTEGFDALMEDAVNRSERFNEEIASQMGMELPPIRENREVVQLLEGIKEQTHSEWKNITQSMGFAVRENGATRFLPIAEYYQHTLDFAALGTSTGTMDYVSAVRKASRELAASGLRVIDYASGHKDSVEVAVRRAVVTGVSQVANRISETRLDTFDTDLVEVSAHGGARNEGSGPANHASWQGKVYRWRRAGHAGTSRGRYPDFISVTGYGTGEGLGGWNCRHSFYPFIEGISVRTYTDDELKRIDPRPFEFEGKEYPAYEASQMQRKLERDVRYSKKNLIGLQEGIKNAPDEASRAKLQEAYDTRAVKLQMQRRKYAEFCAAGKLPTRGARMDVVGFGRSEASRASAAARRQSETK